MIKNYFKPACLFIVLILVLLGCSDSTTTNQTNEDEKSDTSIPGIDGETVQLGAFYPQTGGAAAVYSKTENGVRAFLDQVNESGGINGYTFEYVVRDDGYQPSRTVSVTKRLVESDDVFALLAPMGTGTNEAVISYLTEKGVPNIGPICGSEKCVNAATYFIIFPDYFDEAALDAQYIVEELGIEKIAIIYENDSVGIPARDGLRAYLETKDLEPVAEVPIDVDDTEFSSQVLEVQNSEAEAVLFWGANQHLAAALKEADNISFDPKWFSVSYTMDPSTFELAGDLINGVYFGSWTLPVGSDDPDVEKFREAMATSFPGSEDELGFFHQSGYTQASLFAEVFKEITDDGDTPTQKKLIEAVSSFKSEKLGLTENITFENSHRGLSGHAIGQVKNGEFELITEFLEYPDLPKN